MLAQGEFMKLIHSSSKEKDEIFRKIFGTEILDEISNLLKEETKSIKEKLSQTETKLSQLISSLADAPNLTTQQIATADYYNTKYLIDELNDLIAKNESVLNELSTKDLELNEKLNAIITSYFSGDVNKENLTNFRQKDLKESKKIRISFYCTTEVYTKLEQATYNADRSLNYIITAILSNYRENNK